MKPDLVAAIHARILSRSWNISISRTVINQRRRALLIRLSIVLSLFVGVGVGFILYNA